MKEWLITNRNGWLEIAAVADLDREAREAVNQYATDPGLHGVYGLTLKDGEPVITHYDADYYKWDDWESKPTCTVLSEPHPLKT